MSTLSGSAGSGVAASRLLPRGCRGPADESEPSKRPERSELLGRPPAARGSEPGRPPWRSCRGWRSCRPDGSCPREPATGRAALRPAPCRRPSERLSEGVCLASSLRHSCRSCRGGRPPRAPSDRPANPSERRSEDRPELDGPSPSRPRRRSEPAGRSAPERRGPSSRVGRPPADWRAPRSDPRFDPRSDPRPATRPDRCGPDDRVGRGGRPPAGDFESSESEDSIPEVMRNPENMTKAVRITGRPLY